MARNRIKFNSAAFRAILTGSGTHGLVSSAASGIAGRVPGSVVRTIVGGYGGGRIVGFVATSAKTERQAVAQRETLETAAHGM